MKKCKYCGTCEDLFYRKRKNGNKEVWAICFKCRGKQMSNANIGRVAWNKGKHGVLKGWNKGLTKETDPRVRNISEKQKGKTVPKHIVEKQRQTILKKYKTGQIKPWNKGLTKETNTKVAMIGKQNSQRLKGHIPWNKGKSGYKIDRTHINYSKEWKDKIRVANLRENQSKKTLLKRRLSRIRYVESLKLDGMPLHPNIGKYEKELLDQMEFEFNTIIQRQVEILGYFVDGYCKEKNIVFEIDEQHHYKTNGELRCCDINREKTIKDFLGCDFIRFKVGV